MKEDGLIKVLTGLTTIEEIQRVTSEEDEESMEEDIKNVKKNMALDVEEENNKKELTDDISGSEIKRDNLT
jgi:hypothetical protein